MANEWTCETCGETFNALKISALQHRCLIREESKEFHRAFKAFLSSPAGQFAVYYAQRVINAASGSDNTLVES